jgi:iron complex outermembrane receptor protein
VPNTLAAGNIKNEDFFQPQAGVLYKIDANNEVFANYTENQRAFTAAATGGSPFATTQAGFDAIRSKLRPETSKTAEGGYRFGAGSVHGVIAAYYVDFSNRILATTTGAGIVGNPTVLANVGSVRSYGIETGVTWQIARPVTLTASYVYDDSIYRNNVVNAAGSSRRRSRASRRSTRRTTSPTSNSPMKRTAFMPVATSTICRSGTSPIRTTSRSRTSR